MGLSILNERAVGPYGSRTAVGQGPRGGPWILALQPEERAALGAPRRATAADPSRPSRRVPAARATRFGGLALVLGPQRSVGALWIVDRVGRLSSTHTGTPVRIVPPGGPQISMRRQPHSLRSGVGEPVVLAMLDVLASALQSPDGRSPLVQLRASCAWLRAPEPP
jgi:hypothetical protein